jgi:hypothetical protein
MALFSVTLCLKFYVDGDIAHFSHAKHVALNHFCHLPAQKGSSKSRKTTSCRINPATTMRLNRLFP